MASVVAARVSTSKPFCFPHIFFGLISCDKAKRTHDEFFHTLSVTPTIRRRSKPSYRPVIKNWPSLPTPTNLPRQASKKSYWRVQKNAQVNDGYQVLKSPLSRAEHLLEIRGVELQHEQQTMQDHGFLMQQMEWREELEEIEQTADPLDVLANLDDDIQRHIKRHLKDLKALLDEETAQNDLIAADEVRKLKFLYKLRLEIELKEDSLSDL